MMRLIMVTAALILCLNACSSKHIVTHIPIDPDKIDCVKSAARPKIASEYKIDWQHVKTVATARSEHDAFVASIRDREHKIAAYIIAIENQLFLCASDAQFLRDREQGLAP